MKIEKIYISGKITGEPNATFIFETAEKKLSDKGFSVVNPMKLPHNHDKNYISYMREDIRALCECGTIFMLNNWHKSKGAAMELHIANLLNINVIFEII